MKHAARALLLSVFALAPMPDARAQAAPPAPPAPAARTERPPDVPAGDARIVGRVLEGAANAPVPNVEVVLYSLLPDGTPGLRRTHSDAAGAYAFDGVSGRSDIAYLVGARHHDIPVPGGRISFAPGQKSASADIRVADLTSDVTRVRVRAQTLHLYREATGLRVEESFDLDLPGDEIAFVPAPERAKKPPGLRATLPSGATDFQMPLGVIPDGLERRGAEQRYFGPFYPGAQDLTWSYRLAPSETQPDGVRFRFAFTPAAGVESFAVVVPEGTGTFDAPGLANAGTRDEEGRRATRFTAAHPTGTLTLTLDAPSARVDPHAVAVHEVQIVCEADDAAISVTETHVLSASGRALLIGTPESPLLRVPLPANARDVRFGTEATGLAFEADSHGGVAVLGSLAPGDVPVQVAYRVPVGPDGARLTRSFGTRVALLRVFVADTGRLVATSSRLHRSRPVRTDDRNYLALEAFDIDPGEPVPLALDRLPPRSDASPAAARSLAAAVALCLFGWMALPLRRRSDGAAAGPGDEPGRDEREALLDAIRDLDHDFETAKVSAEDHTRLRDELRARAAALIAGPRSASPPAAPAAARACPSCAAAVEAEHRFCARCGTALGTPAA